MVLLGQPNWGSMGILLRQLWSFAGDYDRNEVNQSVLEPFVNYNLEEAGSWGITVTVYPVQMFDS